MKSFFMIMMLAGLLVLSYLIITSLNAPKSGGPAPLQTIDRAQRARDNAEQAGKETERFIGEAAKE
jgi:hypothetical protein